MQYRWFGTFRFLLAILVVLQHFAANTAPSHVMLLLQPYEPGSVAVLVFFCLSGFVIVQSASGAYINRPGAFVANRALRILPHFLLALAMSTLLQYVLFAAGALHAEHGMLLPQAGAFTTRNILLNSLGMIPGTDVIISYNFLPIAWALRVEVTFYGVIAACLFVARRYKIGLAVTIIAAAGLLEPLFVLALWGEAPPLFGFLPYFSFGAALYFWRKGQRVGSFIAIISLIAVCVHFLSQPLYHSILGFHREAGAQLLMLGTLIALMVLLGVVRPRRLTKADRFMGNLSYPLYLYHYVVLVLMASATAKYTYSTFALGVMLSLLVSLLMTQAMDSLIERYRDQVRTRRLAE
jgi:peptidoglycan/LPS O-acetylase OafA/YrhL